MIKLRYTMFVVTVLSALALSALMTVPALADDSTPPPTETPTVETPPTEEVAPIMEETVPTPETVTEVLATVPEGTDIVVVNNDGEVVPLASTEATDIIDSNDPIWCPTGVAPNPGVGGCTTTQDTFNYDLIPLLYDKKANGTIWILGSYQGTISTLGTAMEGGPITLDGGSLGTIANYTLTVKGGWTGTAAGAIDASNPSEFNVPLSIINWKNAVTVNNLLITNANSSHDPNKPDTAYALNVNTTAKITINNVDVVNNTTDTGNYGGAFFTSYNFTNNTGGGVAVNDSTFNGNMGEGVYIGTYGAITIKNMSANGNTHYGARIFNADAISAKSVVFTGSNNFISNGYGGLSVLSGGAIILSNATATYNGYTGVELNNCFYNDSDGFCHSLAAPLVTTSPITVKGTSTFSNNGWDGLRIWSSGAITISNITADSNGTDASRPGMYIGYDAYGKGVFLHNYGSYSPQSITIIGTNTFNGNASTGLYANGWGKISVNNLTANDNNGCDTLKEAAYYCAGAYLDGSGVIITGYGVFNGNYNNGLYVASYGAVTLNNLYAENNGFVGAGIDSYGPPSVVNLLGTNFFSGNQSNGLYISSDGAITTNNITSVFNGYGVYLDTCHYDPTPDDCTGVAHKAVAMNGSNNISNNVGDGLYIESLGTIKVNNLTAIFNGGNGAVLDNNWNGTAGSVTITGFANTSMNGNRGLSIYSRGAVTTSNLTANGNAPAVSALADEKFYDGVFIANATDPTKLMNVTLLGINQFNDNWNSGLQISSYGIVVLNNITANNNGEPFNATNNPTPEGDGVRVNNSGSSQGKSVTLNGVNLFNGNLNDGLEVLSKGAIVVNKVRANENGGNGATLNNQNGAVNSPITLVGYGIFTDNGFDGLYALSNGAITMTSLTANSNQRDGAWLQNESATITPVTVTLLGVNFFNNNFQDGLRIYSDGQITVNNITANDNPNGSGARLDNVTYGSLLAPRGITLLGTNTFMNNFLTGLYFGATGNVILTRITAGLNSIGVHGDVGGTISFTCGSLTNNYGTGYNLTAGIGKLITLKGVFSYGNSSDDLSSSPPVITRTCPLP